MIINPAIIVLLGSALLTVGVAVYACMLGAQIVDRWDLSSGSSLQLQLERRTFLISTIMGWMLSIQIFTLFLFVFTADHLHPMFVGAMCAAGTFNANGYGYPALIVKIISVLCCGIWLIINQADSQAEDYPLIRIKYRLLFGVSGILILDALIVIAYFKGLEARIITSCCGALFSTDTKSIAGEIAALPPRYTRITFFVCAALHMRSTIHLLATGHGGQVLGWVSALYFIVAMVSVISFISVYYYQLPTHHCPFDMLQAHYHYIGYPLYASLFGFAIAGMGVGVLDRFGTASSLTAIVARLQRRYGWISLVAGLLFLAIAVYPMFFTTFTLAAT
jgi:hypothetical protein